MTSSWERLPDEEPGPDDARNRALISLQIIANQRYPERPINLPEGQDVKKWMVVPVHERKAFIAGAAWQAAQMLAVLEPFTREADALSLSGALGHITRAHLVAARDLFARLSDLSPPEKPDRLSEDYVG